MPTEDDAYALLYRLGVPRCYRGSKCAAIAMTLAANEPERLELISKRIYPDVARKMHIRMHCVERNIRTVISHIWECSPDNFASITGVALDKPPQVSQFISILTDCLRRS
jgi:hypothetical protein